MTTETEEKKKSEDAAKRTAEIAAKLQGAARPILDVIVFLIPIILKYGRIAKLSILKLPTNAFNFVVGFVCCFAGGLYPLLFAAVQAAEYGGRKALMNSIQVIADEATKIIEASKKDDKIDADKDGIYDVDQLETKEYVQRKFLLVLTKMDPKKIDEAVSNIYHVWLAVAAVLTIEFAREVSLALSIADFLKRPIDRYLAPAIQTAVPKEYDRWVPVILGWIAKAIGMSITFYVRSVRSAFASALTGGLIMARAAYQALIDRNINLGGILADDHNDSMADEALSYVFAAVGFLTQVSIGFRLPFPLNLVFWPFSVAEWAVRWLITSSATIPK